VRPSCSVLLDKITGLTHDSLIMASTPTLYSSAHAGTVIAGSACAM
jgi:hypothetical protein